MLKKHQITDKKRNDAIYRYWLKHQDEYGTKAKLARKYDITLERIRKIIQKYQPVDKKN